MPPTAILLFGAGGPLSVEVEESCARRGVRVAAAVLNRPGAGHSLDPTRLLHVADLHGTLRELRFLCPLFTPANRRVAVQEAEALGLRASAALVDPTAVVATSATLADGSYVNAGAILGAMSRLGRHVIVNRGGSVGHHCELAEFVAIGPGAILAGGVRLGPDVLVGAGAVIGPDARIGAGAVIAPGAVLRRDLPDGAVAIGNPARIVRR